MTQICAHSRAAAALAVGISGLAVAACGSRAQASASAMHDMPTAAAPNAVATESVEIANFAFSPAVITVKVGATVTWTNKDQDAHTVAITGAGVSKPLQSGDSYAHTFGQPGTYSYRCTIHPNMRGMVVVTSA
ncbi:MAG TPA: cupredoxin family copper-binding protein [Candidatus Dormibacteraeota bacterium]|nr:cupredoxin family copper-binding protein [Candidatus Dormibacteraeota bacterium]